MSPIASSGRLLLLLSLSLAGAVLACESSPPSEGDLGADAGGEGPVATGGTGNASGGTGGTGGTDPGTGGPPATLSATGLYQTDMTTLAEGVRAFTPRFPLYSDGSEKKRWLWLPPGTSIDTSDPDFWIFPAGAKLWKEFVSDGVRVETRLTEKRADGSWWRVAYQWRADQLDADAVPEGVANASGTAHDIPSSNDCVTCHGATRGGVLGFSAVQLAHDDTELNLEGAQAAGLLSAPVTVPSIPGAQLDVEALGYLHANCGTCHNPTGNLPRVDMNLRLDLAALGEGVAATGAFETAIGVAISVSDSAAPGATLRISPGHPDASAVYLRMHSRGELYSMPQLGTEVIDEDGSALIWEWIESLD